MDPDIDPDPHPHPHLDPDPLLRVNLRKCPDDS